MSRLIDQIGDNLNIKFLSIVEEGTKLENTNKIFDKQYIVPLRPKAYHNIFITIGRSFFSIFQCFAVTIYLIVK